MTDQKQVTDPRAEEREKAARQLDAAIEFGEHGVKPKTLAEAARFAQWVVQSGLSKSEKPAHVLMQIQAGRELGLSTMRSLQMVHAIESKDGKVTVCIAAEAQAAIVESRGALEPGTKIRHRLEGSGQDRSCTVWSHPKGGEKIESDPIYLRDFKHLQHKDNWKNYPDRMLIARARTYYIRDNYSWCTNGLPGAEEVFDYEDHRGAPPERDVTPPKGPDPLLASLKPADVDPDGRVTASEVVARQHGDPFPPTDCEHEWVLERGQSDEEVVEVCSKCGLVPK